MAARGDDDEASPPRYGARPPWSLDLARCRGNRDGADGDVNAHAGMILDRTIYSSLRVRVLSVTHGNPSLEEISLSDGQFGPIYPSLADIPRVTDSRG